MRSKSVIFNDSDLTKSSILSGSGKNSLAIPNIHNEDPYFPHRYIDKVVG
jgi:hypothetical protein